MKTLNVLLIFIMSLTTGIGQNFKQEIITSDIDNFWTAYDKIVTTKDTADQNNYINELYIDKGTAGLNSIMEARQYTAEKYIDAINLYPLFWQSIRQNINHSKQFTEDIETAINKLREFYPELKSVPIYFTIGVFRTNGTVRDNSVLIGCELASADGNTIISELPANLNYYYTNYTNSFRTIDLLCTHEYVHAQQKVLVENLLSACLYEGVAEFVSTKVTGIPSNVPAIKFGKQNEDIVKRKFEQDIFISSKFNDWLWSAQKNDFNVRDLGYFIGYAICERYYEMAKNKKKAIKEMIELDYTNEVQIEKFVDRTKFFSSTLKNMNKKFEKGRPKIVGISQFKNGSQKISPNLTEITINFSKPMNKERSGFDYGPLGEEHVLSVKKAVGFSEDAKSFTFEIELKPNQKYQSLVTNAFKGVDGIPLKPYLIDIKTVNK